MENLTNSAPEDQSNSPLVISRRALFAGAFGAGALMLANQKPMRAISTLNANLDAETEPQITRSEYLLQNRESFNPQVNDSTSSYVSRFNLTKRADYDIATATQFHGDFLYAQLMHFANNDSDARRVYINYDDLGCTYGEKPDFLNVDQYDSSSPIIDDQSFNAYGDEAKPVLTYLANTLFKDQKVRLRHMVLANGESHSSVPGLGVVYPIVELKPDDILVKEWLHEMVHVGLPGVKQIRLNDLYNDTQFVTAGESFSKTTKYWGKALDVFSTTEGMDFVEKRFFNREGDQTKSLIDQNGGEGMIRSTNEWLAMLSVDVLMDDYENADDHFDKWPQSIKDIVLEGLDFVVNGNHKRGDFNEAELKKLSVALQQYNQVYLPTIQNN